MNRFVQIAFFALIVTLCQSQKIALKRFAELGFVGEISLGTPAQTFKVVFDTSINDTMIMSDKNPTDMLVPTYSSSSSSSYTAIGTNIEIDYPYIGYADGFLSQDLLQIAGYSIPNQVFLEATYTSFDFFGAPYSGVVGLNLGFDNPNGYSKPFTNLINSKQISNNLYSFWYNRNLSSPNQGELYLGGINPDLYTGSLKYVSLVQTKSWTVKADSVSINGLNYNKNFYTLFSTEHPLIYGDSSSINKIINALGLTNSYSSEYASYYVKQSKLGSMPTIVFTFNGNKFPLKPTEYTYNCHEDNIDSYAIFCMVGFVKIDSPTWILGNIFMRAYYTVFDFNPNQMKIGFATAV